MRYKTEFPACYDEGARNVSVRLSEVAYTLLNENEIDNHSAFINDLVISALQEKDYFKRRMFKNLKKQVEEMKDKYGVELVITNPDSLKGD